MALKPPTVNWTGNSNGYATMNCSAGARQQRPRIALVFHQLNNFGSVSGTPESHADVGLSLHVHASKIISYTQNGAVSVADLVRLRRKNHRKQPDHYD